MMKKIDIKFILKADKSDKLSYAIVKEEKDIETKKFVEEECA